MMFPGHTRYASINPQDWRFVYFICWSALF